MKNCLNYHKNKILHEKKLSLYSYAVHASSSRNESFCSFVLFVVGTSGNGPIVIISSLISSSANSSSSLSKSASLYKSDAPNPGDDIALAISSAKTKKRKFSFEIKSILTNQ